MQRLSIARLLPLALAGAAVALAVVAVIGISSLDDARQPYEHTLIASSSLATAVANLQTAATAQQEVIRDARGPLAASVKRRADVAYGNAAAQATSLARSDPTSERLVHAMIVAQSRARALAARGQLPATSATSGPLAAARSLAAGLQARQRTRQTEARSNADSASRDAIIVIAIAGLLALIGGLVVITALTRGIRRPLDKLARATHRLASGNLEERVRPAGPRELRDLGAAFNTMADDLSAAQRRIEAERHRLAVTIESLGDALIVTEPGSSTIAAVNPRAAELVPELAVGGDVDAEGSPLPPLAQALGKETTVEHAGRTLAVTAATLGSESDGVVWTVRDMSERARLERAKSEFVAMASHELRSPLTSIKGFVELLARSPQHMSERQREFVEIISRSTDRLVELVGDLLDVARIEADQVEINPRPIDVGDAVQEVSELLGPRLAAKHQELTVDIAPGLPFALADPARVREVVANLLTNALLYTGEGGKIRVAVEPDGAWVQIVVTDTGVGMTQEETEHIFERFYRGRGSAETSPGTGLGLWIVKSLVELHHGEITVQSEPGRGSTFRVRLPATTASGAPPRDGDGSLSGSGGPQRDRSDPGERASPR